jgi:glutamate/tyrosine decarboxylase-like PLP-dependent enzyme
VAARESRQITPENVRQQVIYTTRQVHHCIDKALRIAGLHHAVRRIVPMDSRSRMDMGALQRQIAADEQLGLTPMLLVASAGTTDTGAIDPLSAAAEVARRHGMWYHIDAAYGGFFILTDYGKEVLQGIELADSLVVDPHKGLFLSYGTGAVLIRDGAALYNSHYYQASYLQDTLLEGAPFSPADLSPELTKHFRGLRLWLPLQLFGTERFTVALEEKRLLALYFTHRVQQLQGFEIAHEPDLSVVLFRYLPANEDANAYNAHLVKAIHRDGRVFVSSTTVAGTFWLHLAVLSFRTHRDTIDTLITVLEELTEQ